MRLTPPPSRRALLLPCPCSALRARAGAEGPRTANGTLACFYTDAARANLARTEYECLCGANCGKSDDSCGVFKRSLSFAGFCRCTAGCACATFANDAAGRYIMTGWVPQGQSLCRIGDPASNATSTRRIASIYTMTGFCV